MARVSPSVRSAVGHGMGRLQRRGLAAVEAALMIPLLVTMVFGSIEFGMLLHTRHTMLHAAREAARVLAVQGGTVAQAEAAAHDALPGGELDFDVEVTPPGPDDFDRDVVVEVSLPMADAGGNILGMMDDNERMQVRVTMRSEQ